MPAAAVVVPLEHLPVQIHAPVVQFGSTRVGTAGGNVQLHVTARLLAAPLL
jgi:hypothetical protein